VNATDQSEITRYVDGVRAALADLPPDAREDLLEDLADHLAEVAAEGEGTLEERLGPPTAYAAELRASAGLTGSGRRAPMDLAAAAARTRRAARTADLRLGRLIGYERGSDFARLLRPGWWVLRGYLAAMLLLAVLGPYSFGLLPKDDELGWVWFAAVAAAVIASVRLAKTSINWHGWPARLMIAVNGGLVVALLIGSAYYVDRVDFVQPTATYDNPYSDVKIFPYDRDGNPLTGVRLVDRYGNPVRVGDMWCEEEGDWDTYPVCDEPHPFPRLRPLPTPTPEPTPEPTTTPVPLPSLSVTPTPSPGR
jgi:HAAS domain-containing protein